MHPEPSLPSPGAEDTPSSLRLRLQENLATNRALFAECGLEVEAGARLCCRYCGTVEEAVYWSPVESGPGSVTLECPVCRSEQVRYRSTREGGSWPRIRLVRGSLHLHMVVAALVLAVAAAGAVAQTGRLRVASERPAAAPVPAPARREAGPVFEVMGSRSGARLGTQVVYAAPGDRWADLAKSREVIASHFGADTAADLRWVGYDPQRDVTEARVVVRSRTWIDELAADGWRLVEKRR